MGMVIGPNYYILCLPRGGGRGPMGPPRSRSLYSLPPPPPHSKIPDPEAEKNKTPCRGG